MNEPGGGLNEPVPLSPRVSHTMKRVRQKGTKPEKALSSELFRRGMRFRVNYKQVPGSPDIAFTKAKIAVFVDGCFWHACPLHGSVPKNNREWWEAKLERNATRDRKADQELEAMGWIPLRYWEHDDIEEIAHEIEWVWIQRRDT